MHHVITQIDTVYLQFGVGPKKGKARPPKSYLLFAAITTLLYSILAWQTPNRASVKVTLVDIINKYFQCFLKEWAILGRFFIYFRLFKQILQFLQQIYVKNVRSIQYTAPGFESSTIGRRVSSHNH